MYSQDFIKTIKEYIIKEALLKPRDRVVLGVSGGADSTALLYVMHELSSEFELTLKVVTVDHGLRAVAKDECRHVSELCESLGIPCVTRSFDVNRLSRESGLGSEEMGRKVRYEAFNEAAASLGEGVRIAVAHNKNDLAETMLFHLFRGTGPKGLCSILPKRDNIIRPLLCVDREAIEQYLDENGYSYYTDATNLTDDYSRNMIRHNIIDYAVKNINDNSVDHMAKTAEMLRELMMYADREAGKLMDSALLNGTKDSVAGDNAITLKRDVLAGADPYIRKTLYKNCMDLLVPHNRDITARHFDAIEKLLDVTEHKSLDLPYSLKAETEAGMLIFKATDAKKSGLGKTLNENDSGSDTVFEYEIAGESGTIDINNGFTIRWYTKPRPSDFVPVKNEYTKCFDYDKIHNRLMVRTARPGDYLTINSALDTRKLSDYFIDIKIPHSLRSEIPLIADGSHVYWVIGHRISEYPKVSDETKTLLYIEVNERIKNGQTSC